MGVVDLTPIEISAWHRRWRRLVAVGLLRLLALGTVGGALCGGVAWVAGSEGGLRWLCATLVEVSGGRLQIAGVGGRLLGDWRVRSLRWADGEPGGTGVGVEQLVVRWSPAALAQGRLAFARISAEQVSLTLASGGPPATLPDSLRLPFAFSVDALHIGRLSLGSDGAPDAARLSALSVGARLLSDGREHRIEDWHATIGRTMLNGDATLAGDAPFALSARAVVRAGEGGFKQALTLLADGTLARLRVVGRTGAGQSAGAQCAPAVPTGNGGGRAAGGELEALLAPFAALPIASLRVRLCAIDPALFAAGAPRALIDADLALLPEPADATGALSGHLRLRNRAAGAVDRDRLPVQSLSGRLAWRGDALRLDALELAVAGGGSLHGSAHASLRAAALDLDVTAQGIDASALHAGLPATRLGGPLRAALSADRQKVDVDWRDARYGVRAIASADAQAIVLDRLRLAAAGAGVTLSGRIDGGAERRFAGHGEMRDVDLASFAAWLDMPAAHSRIRGDFDVRGALRPAPELALRFSLGGALGGQPLAGRGDIDWRGGRLRHGDIDLQAAGNRLRVAGALGRGGEALRLTLAAPRIAALGWPGLGGEVAATASVAGNGATRAELARTASGEVSISATRLRLGEVFAAARLTLDAHLGAGANGALGVAAHCAQCRATDVAALPFTLDLDVAGDRQRQRGQVRVALPRQVELRLAASGAPAVGGSAPAPVWRGTLNELRLARAGTDAPVLGLLAPAAISVGPDALTLGTADFSGRLARIAIDHIDYAAGRWRSSGRWQQLSPYGVLAELSEWGDAADGAGWAGLDGWREWRDRLAKAGAQTLLLAGEWACQDLVFATAASQAKVPNPAAHFAVWRERGDLSPGGGAFGIEAARLQADLVGQRLALDALVRSARYGEASADLAFDTAAAAPGRWPPVGLETPWRGSLRADLADLSWLAPLLGDGWRVAGRLRGQMALAGSAARPQLSGQWHGEGLALSAVDLGLRLGGGEAELEITPQRLLLHRLRLTSEFSPMPSALREGNRVDAARLTATPGVVEASGELPLAPGGGSARLAVRFDRFGAVQRADQWAVLSGEAGITVGAHALEISGALRADAAFSALTAVDRPRLADDVVLRGAPAQNSGHALTRAVKVDLALDLGPHAYLRGAGVDSRLAGELRIRSDDAGLPRATGTIRTVDGRFDAYGQKLAIERGIVNFQGAIDDPGLNLRAMRKNQAVEAGVEVTGTARRPRITLVSTPDVPDAEKLSWLVLGRSPEQQGGDGALLFAAAQTLIGGQDGGALRQLQRALGIDEFGVASGQLGGLATAQGSRVASAGGFGSGSQTVNGQIVSVGKRLADNAVLSYQQSLNTTESIVKLTLRLGSQFSVVGSAGSDSAIDFFWTRSFGH